MAEASRGGNDTPEWEIPTDATRRQMKAPNKKKFVEDNEEINVAIKAAETEMKSLIAQQDDLQLDQRTIRLEKEKVIARRKKDDFDLKGINQEITKQMAELTKVQSNLPYKNEQRINEAIGRLEAQLNTQNFRLREERRIVAEIDTLKRSRKALDQYITLKKENDGVRDRQRRMRVERDEHFKAVTSLKQREDDIKRREHGCKVKAGELKKVVDELYEKKRALAANFKLQEKAFQQERERARWQVREEFKQRKEQERRQLIENFEKELIEYEASREPFEDEKQLCNTLILYLQRYLAAPGSDQSASDNMDANTALQDPAMSKQPEGMTRLRKKSEVEENLFSGITKCRRSKREKRKSMINKVAHTPEIFAQFASLSLGAPSNLTEVAESIGLLQEKLTYFENLPGTLAAAARPNIQIDSSSSSDSHTLTRDSSNGAGPGGDSGSEGACLPDPVSGSEPESSGINDGSFTTESAISVPSTPEVLFDNNQPPLFPTQKADGAASPQLADLPLTGRKLSRDSGCDQNSSADEFDVTAIQTEISHALATDLIQSALDEANASQKQDSLVSGGGDECRHDSSLTKHFLVDKTLTNLQRVAVDDADMPTVEGSLASLLAQNHAYQALVSEPPPHPVVGGCDVGEPDCLTTPDCVTMATEDQKHTPDNEVANTSWTASCSGEPVCSTGGCQQDDPHS